MSVVGFCSVEAVLPAWDPRLGEPRWVDGKSPRGGASSCVGDADVKTPMWRVGRIDAPSGRSSRPMSVVAQTRLR